MAEQERTQVEYTLFSDEVSEQLVEQVQEVGRPNWSHTPTVELGQSSTGGRSK